MERELSAAARALGIELVDGQVALAKEHPGAEKCLAYSYSLKSGAWTKDAIVEDTMNQLRHVLAMLDSGQVESARAMVARMTGTAPKPECSVVAPGAVVTATATSGTALTTGTATIAKKKRLPNGYNQFVSETMKRLTSERPDLTSKQCMAEAVKMWKERSILTTT